MTKDLCRNDTPAVRKRERENKGRKSGATGNVREKRGTGNNK